MKKWLKRISMIQLLIYFSVLLANAQETSLSGKVSSKDGNPLPGVTVVVKGTSTGTITDSDGHFVLKSIVGSKTLVFSFIGMKSKEVPITSSTSYNVILEEDTYNLDEVVAIGYGTVKKSDLTGSIASVKSVELSVYPTMNAVQALSGRAAGVQIKQNTGAPGAAISVRIRGTNSVQGSNEPLYVVDGFPIGSSLSFINNSDIESLEVLKDASATAIYGSRGANGVILITTKEGKTGKTKVDFESSFGIQTLRKKLDLMNATEYAKYLNEFRANTGLNPFFSKTDIDALGKGFDWQDFVLRKAPIQNKVITVSWGTEKTKFSISGSMFNQDGIIKNSYSDRYSFRFNLNHELSKKFSVSSSTILTKVKEQYQNSGEGTRGATLIVASLGAFPTLTPYNEDGSYRNLGSAYPWAVELKNPLNFLNEQISTGISNKVLSNAAITYKPFSKLSIRILGGIENSDGRSDYYQTLKFVNSPNGSASVSTSQYTSLLSENTATYNNTIGKHTITALAGFTFQNFLSTSLGGSGQGFLSDNTQTYNLASAASAGIPSSSYSLSTILSYIGRINYNYNNKYLATVTFRSDGSSKYSEGDKWGYFPSAALAWRISNENFLKGVRFLSDLKLRAGWGVTGSQAINAYATLNQLNSGKTIFGDALYTTFAPGTRLPGNLKWESTKQTDIGLDAGFFNNRINFSADYYIKNTSDLLNSVLLPVSLGYTNTIRNVGAIRNSGLEFVISANILSGGELTWTVDGNISFNRNKVVKLYGGKDVLGSYYNITLINDYFNILREGKPLGSFYGYTETGYNDLGQIQYLDVNKDGVINEFDKKIIGDPNPDFIYGLNSTLSYKNFDLTFFLQGVQGNDIFNLSSPCLTLDYTFGLNSLKEVYEDHWTPNHTDAKYPALISNTNVKASNRFIEDGSFLRLKNIQLTYNLPCEKWGMNFMRNAQIYISGQNLLTLTKYSWWDPEVNSEGGATSINQGIDFQTYPTAKAVSFGIRVGF